MMFQAMLQHLIDGDLVTVKEIGQVTGRGGSTIYRWLGGESEPGLEDVEKLLTHLRSPEAKRKILGYLTRSVPVSHVWQEDQAPSTPADARDKADHDSAQDALDRSMLAMRCLSDVLWSERQAINEDRMSESEYAWLVDEIETVIRHLTLSRNLMSTKVRTRKKAR